jgi:hypothetical protein
MPSVRVKRFSKKKQAKANRCTQLGRGTSARVPTKTAPRLVSTFEETLDSGLPVRSECGALAQMNLVGPQPDELVHVADGDLTTRLARFPDERCQDAEGRARKRAHIFEIEHESIGEIRSDEQIELLAQFGSMSWVGNGARNEFDDHHLGMQFIIQVECDVRRSAA